MANNYLKPQEPLFKKNKETGEIDYFYPLVTDDQVILEDGTRLNTYISNHEESIDATIDEHIVDYGTLTVNLEGSSVGAANPINADTLGGYNVEDIIEQASGTGTDGKSAYDIWLEQGNTGTEQDFLDSLKGEIPGKLPNPHKLIFTGAVNTEYDGSEEMTVDIPIGGDNEEWELIASCYEEMTDINRIVVTTDTNGNAFKLKKAIIHLWSKSCGWSYAGIGIRDYYWFGRLQPLVSNKFCKTLIEKDVDGRWFSLGGTASFDANSLLPLESVSYAINRNVEDTSEYIEAILLNSADWTVLKYEIYGVRA